MTQPLYDFHLFISGGGGSRGLGRGTLPEGREIVEDLEVRFGAWFDQGCPEIEGDPTFTYIEGCDIMAVPVEKDRPTMSFGEVDWEAAETVQ